MKKSGFELSSWPSIYICIFFHCWRVLLAEIFEEIGSGLETFGPTQGLVTGSCEQDNELPTAHKEQNFLSSCKRASQEQLCSKEFVSEETVRCFKYWKNTPVYFFDIQRTVHRGIFL
jgi:hypothetical protein